MRELSPWAESDGTAGAACASGRPQAEGILKRSIRLGRIAALKAYEMPPKTASRVEPCIFAPLYPLGTEAFSFSASPFWIME